MAAVSGGGAHAIIDRLAAIDRQQPVLDRSRVEAALRLHFDRLGLACPPTRWVADAEDGYTAAWSPARSAAMSATESAALSAAESAARSAARLAAMLAARSAAWSAAESAAESAARSAARLAAWLAAWSPADSAARSAARSASKARPGTTDQRVGIWLPFLEAAEAGLWLFWVTSTEVIAVPRPALQISDDRLHCADGAAVAWPNGRSYWFWRGVQVKQWIIEQPTQTLTKEQLFGIANVEQRRALIERIGTEAFLRIAEPTALHEDTAGNGDRRRLLGIDLPNDPDRQLVAVEVSCPSTGRQYLLRVPPNTRTCQEAVAWSFGIKATEYQPIVET